MTPARLALGLIAVGLLWRIVRYLVAFPIWGDEAFVAVNFVTRGYADMIRPLDYGQIVPLVFMWAELAITRALGLSEWALRLLPTLAGIASLLLFWRFAHRVLPRRPALLAVSIFAASFYVVRHGAEVKPYATDLLISLVLTMLTWRVCQRPQSPIRWIVLILAAGVSVWCSYPAIFVAGSAGLVLTWLVFSGKRRPAILAAWLAFGLVVTGSFLAMYVLYAHPHAVYAARLTEINMWEKTFPPLTHPLRLIVWLFAMHAGLMLAYPHGGVWGGSIATLIAVIIGSIRLWRTHRTLLALLLLPLPLMFIAAAFKAYPYGGTARTTLYLAPAFCLLAGLGANEVLHRFLHGERLRIAWRIAALAPAVIPLGVGVNDVIRPYDARSSYDSRAAVRAIARQTAPGDRWIMFNAVEPVDYAPYLGDWRGVGSVFVFDALRYSPAPITWAPPPDSVEPPSQGRTWFLVYYANSSKVTFPQAQFDAYLSKLMARLGPAQHQSYSVKSEKNKVEMIEAYRFGP